MEPEAAAVVVPPHLKETLHEFTCQVLQQQPTDLDAFGESFFSKRRSSIADDSLMEVDEEGEDELMDENYVPPGFKRGKRQSVCAEIPNLNAISVLKLNTHQKPAHVTERLLETMERILLFNSLDEEDKRTLVDAMFKRETVSGECVIRQGSDGDNFYIVEMGLFDVYIQGVHLGEYDNIGQFGELALMYNCPRAATVLSVGAGALWCLDRDTFRNITLGKAAAQRRLYDEALKTNPLIKDLSEAERTKLADSLEKVGFKDNERIIHQGDPADAMYLIVAGHAKVTRHVAASSTEVLIDTLGSGQYFGELALLTDKPRAASVWAKGPLTCAKISKDGFERLLGPCQDIMKRNAGGYEARLEQLFGRKDAGGSYLSLELTTL